MAKKKLTSNMVLRHIDGRYYIFRATKRLDSKIYHAHPEGDKIVVSRIHEEISPDECREYMLCMKDNIAKATGDNEMAEQSYNHHMKEFGLLHDDSGQTEQEPVYLEGEVV